MRILALITDLEPGSGGISRFNRDLISALSSTKPKNSIFILPRKTVILRPDPLRGLRKARGPKDLRFFGLRPQNDGVSLGVLNLLNKARYLLSSLKALLTHGPFDLIFCGHLNLAPVALLLSWFARIPFWLELHGIEAWERPKNSTCLAVERSRLVTAVSRYTRRRFLQWADLPPEKVRVLPNTVDKKFSPGPKPDYLLKRYGLEGKKVLLTVSRLSSSERYKGHDRVIEILREVLREKSDLVYVIAGEGDDRGRLERLCREKGLNSSVKFIGVVKESELADHYRMADLYVMPSTGEGFGVAFLEAVACGIPVVGGNQDGSLDALREGRSGQAVDPHDLASLSQAILRGLRASNKASLRARPAGLQQDGRSNLGSEIASSASPPRNDALGKVLLGALNASNPQEMDDTTSPFSSERFSSFVGQLLSFPASLPVLDACVAGGKGEAISKTRSLRP